MIPVEQLSDPMSIASLGRVHDDRKQTNAARVQRLSFRQTFGLLGIPLVLFLLVSIAWTMWLIVMALFPNETANYLMNTGSYDDGQFWLLVDQDVGLKAVNVTGLMLAEVGYLQILMQMLMCRAMPLRLVRKQTKLRKASTEKKVETQPNKMIGRLWTELTSINGSYRKFWNLWHKVADLITQAVLLNNYLEKGFPNVMVYGWAGFISANCLSCVQNILLYKHSALYEILLDSVFDLFATVVYPILVLTYCYHNFQFDHKLFQTYADVLPPGSYEIIARLFADPTQVELFRVNFNSLRDQTPLILTVRLLMNVSFWHRFKAVVTVLMKTNRRLVYPRRNTNPRMRLQKMVPKPTASLFLLVSVLVIPYTHLAIQTSAAACTPYPQCVVYAHRFPWSSVTKEACPCRTMVDIDRAPKTFEEWINPVDVSEDVKSLAATGDLKVLRLMNRQLLQLPIELQNCQMEHISLIYTSTTSLPDWAASWKSLEFLHIEGKQGSSNLEYLPSDLFSNMPKLLFLHLALHTSLETLPAFSGTPRLQTVELAHLFGLTRLPAVDKTTELRNIVIAYLPRLETLPDLLPLKHLISLIVFRPSFLCCNGYLSVCDLSDSFCDADPTHGFPAATCLADDTLRASPSMVALLQSFGPAVCLRTPDNLLEFADIPTKTSVDMCGGVPYRQCHLTDPANNESIMGMCYNLRMQVLSCNPDPNNIAVRKLQIKLKVGTPCNVVEEAWLGCRTEQPALSDD